IVYSMSRMGFVASLISLALMGAVAWGIHIAPRARWALAAVLISAIVLNLQFLWHDQLMTRIATGKQDIQAENLGQLWQESLSLLRRFPIFGCGLGTYGVAFLRYKIAAPAVADNLAYNDYLQLLIELGAAGFSLAAVFCVS